MAIEPDAIALKDAAAHYQVSTDTLYRLVAAGRIKKFTRPNDKRYYLSRSQLDEYFKLKAD